MAAEGPIDAARDALRRQDYAAVEVACAGVPADGPGASAAARILAQARAEQGRTREARTVLEAALGRMPDDERLGVALARRDLADGRFDEARARLEAMLQVNPDSGAVAAGLAEVLERAGDEDALVALLGPRLRDAATPPGLAAVAVRTLATRGRADEAIALGTAVADADGAGDRRDLLFSLARALERAGRHDEAFDRAAAANAIRRPAFDPDAFDAHLDAIAEVFTEGLLAKLRRGREDEGARAVFVVGLPRCGSTLVERILDAHPQVHGLGETPEMHRVVADLPESMGTREAYPACARRLRPKLAARLGTGYLDAVARRAPRTAARLVNKDLGVLLHLGLVEAVLPGAKVIRVHRAPLDQGLALWLERLRPSAAPYATDLGHVGRAIRATDRLMDHWRAVRRGPLLEVSYEALVAEPEAHARSLVDFLGLPWHDACRAAHASGRTDRTLSYDQARRPVSAASVGRADAYGARLDPLRTALGLETNGGTGDG